MEKNGKKIKFFFMTCYIFSNSELNSEIENMYMIPYMYVFKKFIFTYELFTNRRSGTRVA